MKVMRVIEAFSCDVDGVPRVFTEGMLLKASDPVCKGRERFLMDAEVYTDSALGVEQATAAPGERRSIWAKKSSERARKRAEEANRTGADDGEADPESGSNQVKGVNKVGVEVDETGREKDLTKAEQEALDAAAPPSGADDGEADPESGASQVPGVNDDPSAKPGDGYDDGMSGTADDGGPTTGITTDDVEPKPAKKGAAKKPAPKKD